MKNNKGVDASLILFLFVQVSAEYCFTSASCVWILMSNCLASYVLCVGSPVCVRVCDGERFGSACASAMLYVRESNLARLLEKLNDIKSFIYSMPAKQTTTNAF